MQVEPRILLYDKEKSYGEQNTDNMLIHGDNLLALKALEAKYAGQVKCVYIDPPYNTGSADELSVYLSIDQSNLTGQRFAVHDILYTEIHSYEFVIGDVGLTYTIMRKHWQTIFAILYEFSDGIEWVKLFGSRSRGDSRNVSDVDLAVSGKRETITKLAIAFEDSLLPYTFDVIDYKRQSNEKLKYAIDTEGKLIYSNKGASVMKKMQIEMKQADYHRALGRLRSALQKEPDADAMYLDATIQRFEFCFELAWKLMKCVLDYEGIEVSSPRSSIREGWKQGMIVDAETWLDMQEKRNLSTHTYNESTALEVYQLIKEKYVDLLSAWDKEVQRRLESDQSI